MNWKCIKNWSSELEKMKEIEMGCYFYALYADTDVWTKL